MNGTSRLFHFTVKHLHFLSRVPGFPHFFDALLVTLTCLFSRSRLAAMEALEAQALHWPDVSLQRHRFGGIEFRYQGNRELGHIHGHGLLDVPLPRDEARRLLTAGRVQPHHIFSDSGWVSFQLETAADVPFALALLAQAAPAGAITPGHFSP